MEQRGLPRADLERAQQQIFDGDALEKAGRRRPVVDAVGEPDHAVGRDQAIFGIGAGGSVLIDDAVADLERGHPLAQLVDHAGGFRPRREGQLGALVDAGAVVDVDEIDADGGVAQAHLAGGGLRHGHLDPLHHFRSAELFDPDCVGHD